MNDNNQIKPDSAAHLYESLIFASSLGSPEAIRFINERRIARGENPMEEK